MLIISPPLLFVSVDDVQILEALPDVFAFERQQKMVVGRQNLLSSPRVTGKQGGGGIV